MISALTPIISLLPYMALSLILSLILTKVAINLCPRFGLIDIPRGRHQHEHPIPLGGGIAIGLSFFITVYLLYFVLKINNVSVFKEYSLMLSRYTLPAVLILILGLLDDKFEIRSIVKLIGQVVIGGIIYFSGSGIDTFLGHSLSIYVGLPLTICWCIGIINAFNLIDGLDGIAAGLASISSFLLAIWVAISSHSHCMTAFLLIFCGSCLGFLKYNFSPAKIFMGDTGSMFVGLFFAQVSMHSSEEAATFTSLLVPLMALGIPIFDVILAIWRRFFRHYIIKDPNAKIMEGDHDHLHHRIQNQTGQQRRTAYIIYALSAGLSLLTMSAVFINNRLPALFFLVILITIFTFVRYAYIELYDMVSSISDGIRIPHKHFLFTALHPVIDTGLVLVSFWICCLLYRDILLPTWHIAEWSLIFVMPFTVCLCFSGIYRTFWVRTGINQYFHYVCCFLISGMIGFCLNYIICSFFLDHPAENVQRFCAFYIVFFLMAAAFILSERFIIHYFASYGFRELYIKKIGCTVPCKRILIYGGGLYCRVFVNFVYSGFNTVPHNIIIMGICDDNNALGGLNVYGVPVLGTSEQLETIYRKHKFDEIMITIQNPSAERCTVVDGFCRKYNITSKRFICKEE